ncbi:MAG: lysophospholipid acyltransferase family protein [Actinomycetota bacterium]
MSRRDALPNRIRDDPWYRAGVWTVGALTHLGLRIRFHGLENVPRTGGAILAPNHISVLDPIVVALGPVKLDRTVRFLAAAEFFDRGRGVVAWGLRKFRQIPVRRGRADWTALEEIASVVRSGALAGMFPEGRMGDGVELQKAQRGLARIALSAGAPIVPVGIWGTHVRWPRDGLRWDLPLRTRVSVVYGPPIEAIGDAHDRRETIDLTSRVMDEIGKVLSVAQSDPV